jgi:S-adenosyl methyltransferase
VADAARVFDRATERAYVRTGRETAELVVGLYTVEPGLVWTPDWRPEPGAALPNAWEQYLPRGGRPQAMI